MPALLRSHCRKLIYCFSITLISKRYFYAAHVIIKVLRFSDHPKVFGFVKYEQIRKKFFPPETHTYVKELITIFHFRCLLDMLNKPCLAKTISRQNKDASKLNSTSHLD